MVNSFDLHCLQALKLLGSLGIAFGAQHKAPDPRKHNERPIQVCSFEGTTTMAKADCLL